MGRLSEYQAKQKAKRIARANSKDTKKRSSFSFLLIFIIGSIFPTLIWSFSLGLNPQDQFPTSLQNSTVYLLTAHPDDEAMFFGPILHRLKQFNNSVSVICFSTGDNEGIGHVRKNELKSSVSFFGTPEDHVEILTIVDEPKQFPDSMTIDWNPKKVARKVDQLIKADTNKESVNILSFDQFGVSNHTNHRALYKAAYLLSRNSGLKSDSEETPINYAFWTLNTVSVFRKYISIVDSFVIYIMKRLDMDGYSSAVSTVESTTVVSDFEEYSKTLSAMTKAHVSQMKWFRYGWIIFSRYMVVNDVYRVL